MLRFLMIILDQKCCNMVLPKDDDGIFLFMLQFCFSDAASNPQEASASMKGSEALRGLSLGSFSPFVMQAYSCAYVSS